MKKQPAKKLGLNRITIATLSSSALGAAVGGLPGSRSVCADECCDSDRLTNCASRPAHCTN
jgi:hypothetical protein